MTPFFQILFFSYICIRLLLQNYSTTRHVVVYQQQAFDNLNFIPTCSVTYFCNNPSVFFLLPPVYAPPPSQLTAQRPSGLSSQSGSDSAQQCLLLERRGEAEAADVSSPQDRVPTRLGTPTDPLAETLINGDSHSKPQSPVPSRIASPHSTRSPRSSPPRSPSSPHSPRSLVFANGRLSPPVNGHRDLGTGSFSELKDPETDCAPAPCAAELDDSGTVTPTADQKPPPSSPAAPHKEASRRQSRIPVLEPSSLLELPPPGSAKEKLLQKKASHHGPVPSPTASPSLSDRRGPLAASLARDPLSSASDRSQDEDSLIGSHSDRQGDDAASLSSSSSPLSRKSRIPRPVHSPSSSEQLAFQYMPHPPPGSSPSCSTVEGR